MGYAAIYLLAAVIANGAVSLGGPWAIPLVSLFIVPLDLVTRDALHERWEGHRLAARMAGLVLAGAVLSLGTARAEVALGSALAFGAGGVADCLTYHACRGRGRLVRVNLSNVSGAVADSLVFPAVAFGAFIPELVVLQSALKVAGGLVWSLILFRRFHALHEDPGMGHGPSPMGSRIEVCEAARPSL